MWKWFQLIEEHLPLTNLILVIDNFIVSVKSSQLYCLRQVQLEQSVQEELVLAKLLTIDFTKTSVNLEFARDKYSLNRINGQDFIWSLQKLLHVKSVIKYFISRNSSSVWTLHIIWFYEKVVNLNLSEEWILFDFMKKCLRQVLLEH